MCPNAKPTERHPYRKSAYLKGSVYDEWATHYSARLRLEQRNNLQREAFHNLKGEMAFDYIPYPDISLEDYLPWAFRNLPESKYGELVEQIRKDARMRED